MTQRGYRRLTNFLFIFLFLVFFLLYLLLSQKKSASLAGGGWGGNLEKNLGLVELSEIRSGGFIVDQFPVDAPTTVGAANFDDSVLTCNATLHNEGEETIKVTMDIYGTVLENVPDTNPGLCVGYYYYSGDTDPVKPDYSVFLADPTAQFHIYSHQEKNVALWSDEAGYPMEFMLKPGETKHLTLLFWVDETVHPLVTDKDRASYSITVKLTARTP